GDCPRPGLRLEHADPALPLAARVRRAPGAAAPRRVLAVASRRSRGAVMRENRARAFAVLACLGVALALAAPAALGDQDLYTSDPGHFEPPRGGLVARPLGGGGGLPRWIPGIFGGAPGFPSQELALFYPPNDLLLLVAPERARIWGLVFHLV